MTDILLVIDGKIEVTTTVTQTVEVATAENSTPLTTNTISAGTPGTDGYTEVSNSYTYWSPTPRGGGPKQEQETSVAERVGNRFSNIGEALKMKIEELEKKKTEKKTEKKAEKAEKAEKKLEK